MQLFLRCLTKQDCHGVDATISQLVATFSAAPLQHPGGGKQQDPGDEDLMQNCCNNSFKPPEKGHTVTVKEVRSSLDRF
jgi:hypothetical protein